MDPDAQSASFAFDDVDGVTVAGTDLVEDGLARNSELGSGSGRA